jgi:hypothetical protein
MVEATPAASFVVPKPDFLLELLTIPLNVTNATYVNTRTRTRAKCEDSRSAEPSRHRIVSQVHFGKPAQLSWLRS